MITTIQIWPYPNTRRILFCVWKNSKSFRKIWPQLHRPTSLKTTHPFDFYQNLLEVGRFDDLFYVAQRYSHGYGTSQPLLTTDPIDAGFKGIISSIYLFTLESQSPLGSVHLGLIMQLLLI